MIQTSNIAYTTLNTTRAPCDPNTTEPHIVRELTFEIPQFLTEDLWNRHNYSIDDISRTLHEYNPSILWPVSMLVQLNTANSSCKWNSARIDSMVIGAKQNVANRLIRHYRTKWVSTNNVLEQSPTNHIPPLPIHKTNNREMFDFLTQNTLQDNSVITNENLPCVWKGVCFIPIELDQKGRIWMNRIELIDNHFNSHLKPTSLSTASEHIILNDVKHVLSDESFLLEYDEI